MINNSLELKKSHLISKIPINFDLITVYKIIVIFGKIHYNKLRYFFDSFNKYNSITCFHKVFWFLRVF